MRCLKKGEGGREGGRGEERRKEVERETERRKERDGAECMHILFIVTLSFSFLPPSFFSPETRFRGCI